jgi:adenosylcobalamin-dependent ribonucleoside-triphosphate reductase
MPIVTSINKVSTRAEIITRRTYNRPLNKEGSWFETWDETVGRVINHQSWLWQRAKGEALTLGEQDELEELRDFMLARKLSMAGRTLWLGGTQVGQTREASMFNCSFLRIQTVYDCVDALWLLLNGCGVGFSPSIGTLNGFSGIIPNVEFKRADNSPSHRGMEANEEVIEDGIWTIKVGDSAEAWAKVIGKLLSGKHTVHTLVIDTTEIRGPGERLNGYGWICAGDEPLVKALEGVCGLMNRRAGALLTRIDILDLMNWLGTVLSTRRSAEIALFCVDEPEWEEFAVAKKDCWNGNAQRYQSNNSLVFNRTPTREQLVHIFKLMEDAGGSEPGFVNAASARQRAPWFYGVNPCAEILLGDKSFCNLTEIDIGKFRGDAAGLDRAHYIAARANYRQTCVNLNDGILQEAWHLNNQFLRLCGVGHTGIVKRPDLTDYDLESLQRTATYAAYKMADGLGCAKPKNITTVKPSGTLSKIMDTTEGIHKPLGKYILNNVNFSKYDPLLPQLREAGYRVFDNPSDPEAVLVTFPVAYEDVEFDVVDGVEMNLESAIDQLERYKRYQLHYTQQNTSVTISYDPTETSGIIDWLLTNWDVYVGVSFIYRNDPTKTAQDLGYEYLPQEVVTKEVYDEYSATLKSVDLETANTFEELKEEECATGACPIK